MPIFLYPLYNLFIWSICFLIAYNGIKYSRPKSRLLETQSDKKKRKWLFIFFILFSLFTFYSGDDERYAEFVTEGYKNLYSSMEQVYVLMAQLVSPHYLLWKAMIYIPALFFMYYALRKLEVESYITYMMFILLLLYSFGAARAVLPYFMFLFAIALREDKRTKYKFLAYIIAFSTIIFHSSMIVPVIFFIFSSVLSLSKTKVWFLILLLPFLIIGFNYLLDQLFELNLLVGTHAGDRLASYTDDNRDEAVAHSMVSNFTTGINYFLIVLLEIYGLKAYFKKVLTPSQEKIVVISLLTLLFSVLVLLSNMYNSEIFASRYLSFIPFLTFVLAYPIIKYRIAPRWVRDMFFVLAFFKVNLTLIYRMYDLAVNM